MHAGHARTCTSCCTKLHTRPSQPPTNHTCACAKAPCAPSCTHTHTHTHTNEHEHSTCARARRAQPSPPAPSPTHHARSRARAPRPPSASHWPLAPPGGRVPARRRPMGRGRVRRAAIGGGRLCVRGAARAAAGAASEGPAGSEAGRAAPPARHEGRSMVLVHVGYLVLPVFGSVRNRGTASCAAGRGFASRGRTAR